MSGERRTYKVWLDKTKYDSMLVQGGGSVCTAAQSIPTRGAQKGDAVIVYCLESGRNTKYRALDFVCFITSIDPAEPDGTCVTVGPFVARPRNGSEARLKAQSADAGIEAKTDD